MTTDPAIATNYTSPTPIQEVRLTSEVLNQLYATMLKARLVGQRVRPARRTSEAILAGALLNAAEEDVLVSANADPVLEVLRGTEISSVLNKPSGKAPIAERRVVSAEPEIFAGVAAGLASASRIANSDSVIVAFAPGKVTKGSAFERASEFSAHNRLPLVMIADWTDSRRSARNHDGVDLSNWPFPTIAVDGRDVIAVFRVVKEAVSAARRGHGPTLVDCVNFLAPGGRGRDERDILLSFRGYLQRHDKWSDLWHSELLAKLQAEVGVSKSKSRKG